MPTAPRPTRAALRAAFAAPPPAGKRAFLRTLPRPRRGTPALIWQQLCWLRPRVWAAAALVLFAAAYSARHFYSDTLWALGALAPFLAVTLVTESGRAYACGMAELEMASALGLHSLLLARMALLGALHAALLAVLTAAAHAAPLPFAPAPAHLPWARAAACLLLPYLLTAVGGLALCRRLDRRQDATWPCLGVALAVAAGGWAVNGPLAAWLGAIPPAPTVLVLLAALCWQLHAALEQTEELPCS